MVTILPRTKPTFGEQIASGLGSGLQQGAEFGKLFAEKALSQRASEADTLKKLAAVEKFKNSPGYQNLTDMQKFALENEISGLIGTGSSKSLINAEREQSENAFLSNLLGGKHPNMPEMDQEDMPQESMLTQGKSQSGLRDLSDTDLDALQARGGKAAELGKAEKTRRIEQEKLSAKTFQEERGYHTQFSKPIEEKVSKLRESIPRKESALNLARSAIEEGELKYFSPDKIADATGIDLFRTAKGAQLLTAGKENLLSNMSRTSARAQNLWFEQRLNSMFPKIGQSREANLTVQEMLEGELAMDKLYQETFDRLSAEDENNLGFVKKDIDRRVHDEIKEQEKEIFSRTAYRLRELEEQEKGAEKIAEKVGKNVPKGTPLTLYTARLYKQKYGDDALDVAKKNGYSVPTLEQFKRFRERPEEFRENLQ